MARRLILDTSVVIAAERGRARPAGLRSDDEVAVAAITVAEMLVGVELADAAQVNARRARAEALLAGVLVETYDAQVARIHAELLAHVRRVGQQRGAHDLIIAATAVATGRTVLTADRAARFEDLPRVKVLAS